MCSIFLGLRLYLGHCREREVLPTDTWCVIIRIFIANSAQAIITSAVTIKHIFGPFIFIIMVLLLLVLYLFAIIAAAKVWSALTRERETFVQV